MGIFGGKGGDADRGPRDARTRERARLEREKRRAERAGEPPSAEIRDRLAELDAADVPARDPAAVPPPDPETAPAPPPPPVEPEPPRAARPPVQPPVPAADPVEWGQDTGTWSVPDEEAPPELEPTHRRDEPAPPMTPEPAPITPARRRDAVPPPPRRPERVFTDEHDALPASAAEPFEDEHDAPVGVRRVSEAQAAAAAGTAMPGQHRPARPVRPGGPRPRRLARRLGALLLLVLIGTVAWFANALYQPFAGEGGDRVTVKVPEGASASQIGDLLAEKGVVDSGFFFGLRARMSGDRDKLRAATFTTLREGMSYEDALAELTKAAPVVSTVTVTVPEGRSRRETVPIIKESGLRGGYLNATKKREGFSPRRLYGAPTGVKDLEGFLFPATYELRKGANVKDLIGKQLAAFRENFATIDLEAAKRKNLSAYDVLIIASMIEREAALDKERALISGVIYNRLKQGIPLGIDATIRFRLNQWTQPLKVSELNIKSDYNTRTRQGLPPGPIGNPGIKSLRAAAKPATTKALYYVVKPCGDGAHAFSATDAEFQEDVAAYNRERDKRGGKDPSRC